MANRMTRGAIVETFTVYRLASTATPDDIGAFASSAVSNMTSKGTISGRVTPGETLEPDVLGAVKNFGTDVTTWWNGFFDPPTGGLVLKVGDWIISTTDSTRKFQIQFVDEYPGGIKGHHVEVKLQTTELERNG